MAPSRDHVIPKTRIKKGREVKNNTRPAHRWCNSHRQHKDPKKLPSDYFDGLEAAQAEFVTELGAVG